jgi:hypothetical protein
MISKIFIEFIIFNKTIDFMKVMISKIFVEFIIFNKTIDFMKVMMSDKIYKTYD